jgi:NitT/TauT family transport system ATP-binding protein
MERTNRVVRVQLHDISFSYREGAQSLPVLDRVSLELRDGEFVSLLGPSGCGKTTLLNIIAGITRPDQGQASIDGEKVVGTNLKLAYVYQKNVVLPWFTVSRNLELGPKFRGLRAEERAMRVRSMLELGNLQSFGSAYPYQLSGGMGRKLGLLMALAVSPEIMLLDEPFYGLDQYTKTVMHAEVLRIWEAVRGTWLMVTHDIDEAIALSDRVIVMSNRPSRVKRMFDVIIPRPRDAFKMRSQEEYLTMYRDIWSEFQSEFKANE